MARGREAREKINYRLDGAINRAFMQIPPEAARALFFSVREEARSRGFFYEDDDGNMRTINLMLRPRAIDREQRRHFQRVCMELVRALEQLYPLCMEDPEARALLPLEPEEERWMRSLWPRLAAAPQRIFGRLDANADFAAPDWQDSFRFFEPNCVAIGGIHFTPETERIIAQVVVPHLREHAPDLKLVEGDDTRLLLLKDLEAHARAIGRKFASAALVQDRYGWGGPVEFKYLSDYYARSGFNVVYVDPRELEVRGDEIYYRDTEIDVIYRDVELRELAWMEEAGDDFPAMRLAFERNQVVSTLSGDFDHKSAWEVLTDPRFARHFTPKQRQLFRKHLAWTRLLGERKTTDPDGREIDLIPYVRRNKDRLVIKPNREYGGSGVVIGPLADLSAWEQALDQALEGEKSYVAQSYIDPPIEDFPTLADDGSISLRQYYVVCGFYTRPHGLSILGRASKRCVVNVAQQGGLTAILTLD